MQFSIASIALFLSAAMAAPYAGGGGSAAYVPCSGLEGTAQCCATDVLGLADLDCVTPPATLTSGTQFTSTCVADGGRRARCCTLPALGLALVCSDPVGV
uniref:Cerato-ulmin n=1 Tax=Ophiostoma quercus TaxID=108461 RepID=A9XIT1_9PEZI|nr:cerato-ulmin [Ophiostoma quercus]